MNENETAVTVAQPQSASLSLKQITDRVNLVHTVLEKVMKKGTHFGTVPGCGDKMVLLKPGADVLAMTFKLVPRFEVARTDLSDGHREYDVTCSMCGPSGELLGQGVGSCSTMEKKYRYRKDSKGNKIENEDIADVYNTVLKMAKKRAHVDATLTVTGAGDLFTQDLIDEDEEPEKAPIKMPTMKTPQTTTVSTTDPADSGGTPVTGIIEAVSAKPGKKKNGDEYTRYGIKIGDEWYGTFSDTIGKEAEELKGSEATVIYIDDGKYKTATSITPKITAGDGDDNLPFGNTRP